MTECRNHLERMNRLRRAKIIDERSGILLDGIEQSKFTIALPNGSRIVAMTAHPDATRGFGGHILLDEHAFHRDSKELWKGVVGSVLRSHRVLVISTPNYQIGNYFELAREAGLTTGIAPLVNPGRKGIWSTHWVDIYTAVHQLAAIGQPVNIEQQRELTNDDDVWQQEFCCQFMSAAEMWLSLEMIAAARSPLANAEWDPHREYPTNLFVGADIGRRRDRTAIWIDQRVDNNVAICRGVMLLDRMPFEQQYETFCNLLHHPRIRRAAIDETGVGMALVERLQLKFGGKVEGSTFTNANKESMSVMVRRRFEQRLNLIPDGNRDIERDLAAIKRMATPFGNLRFDAERAENSHADIYWAKALADLAADQHLSHVSPVFILGRPRPREFQLWRLPKVF